MRSLLDTNVVSELVKPAPSRQVVAWFMATAESDLFLSVATIGELRRGAASLDHGRRRTAIEHWIANDLIPRFSDRIISVDVAVAEAWGDLMARSRRIGSNLSTMDGFIAATARVHSLILATRNVKDFGGCDLELCDPWAPIR